MRIESKEITEGLYCDDCARHSPLFGNNFLKKGLQRIPATATQMGKQLSIIEEISAENFGYAEYKMSVRNGLEDLFAKPLAKFHYTLLMTRWAEMPPLARKC